MTTEAVTGDALRAPRIAGISALKGLILYAAIVTFAGLYIYFIVQISEASGQEPAFDAALVSAAAALAGVLGSAFALEVGSTPDPASTNSALREALSNATGAKGKTIARLWQALSLEPSDVGSASWPQTFGIWVYAIIASAVAVTYVLNQNQTPGTIKGLAVAFAGYVVALVTAAYKSGS